MIIIAYLFLVFDIVQNFWFLVFSLPTTIRYQLRGTQNVHGFVLIFEPFCSFY